MRAASRNILKQIEIVIADNEVKYFFLTKSGSRSTVLFKGEDNRNVEKIKLDKHQARTFLKHFNEVAKIGVYKLESSPTREGSHSYRFDLSFMSARELINEVV